MKLEFIAIVILLATSGAVNAQAPEVELTADQKGYIAYDQCIMYAAIRASKTPAKDEEIFGIAKTACAGTRAAVLVGQEANKQFLVALDAADAEKAANFPAWIKGVRERRATRDAQFAKPANAPNQ
jgi:hypothetical protein